MTQLLHLGLGKVYTTKNEVIVEYAGNMGASVERNIVPRFEEKFGLGTWDQVEVAATKIIGHPDCWYELHITKEKFFTIVN